MNFRDSPEVPYTMATVFTQEQLLTITPEQLCQWLKYKVYGDPDPGEDDRPSLGRANTLMFAKKAISFYMPNKITTWSVETNKGNPTRSIPINDLICKVKKMQVRHTGKESSARRSLEPAEFYQTLKLLQQSHDIKKQFMVPAAMKF